MSMRAVLCRAVAAALLVCAWGASAGEAPSPRLESPRALNGLVYQPSRLLTGPFATTSFGMATLFGFGQAEAPRYEFNGLGPPVQNGTREYPMAAYGQDLNLDLRLTPDVSLRFDVNGLIFSGVNGKGILVAGTTAQYGASIGVTAGRDLNRAMRLAFVMDAGSEPQLSVLVGNAVIQAIGSQSFKDTGVLSTINRVFANPGLSFAWAFSPAIGFLAETRYVWTRRTSTSDGTSRTAQGVSAGAVGTLDLDPLLRFPFALTASYRGDFPVGSNGISTVHQAGAGIYYSRRPQLALGLELDWRHGAIRPGINPRLTSDVGIGSIQFRYYW